MFKMFAGIYMIMVFDPQILFNDGFYDLMEVRIPAGSLLKPLKRSGGRRYYRAADIEMVQTIDRLVTREGYTLKGAEAVLRAAAKSALDRRKDDRRGGDRRVDADDGELPGVRLMVSEAPEMTEVIAGLKAVRARLAAALGA
jgi:DNA-binding transcriptional MerR regulator